MKKVMHPSFNVSENKQGYIHYSCLIHKDLPPRKEVYIINLCAKVGGEYSDALFETLTTNTNMLYTANNHYMDPSNLCRLVKKFYESFSVEQFEENVRA